VDRGLVMDVVADFDLGPERPAVSTSVVVESPAPIEKKPLEPAPATEPVTRKASSRELFEQISSPRRFAFFGMARR
jgi:hypothetical protein